MAEQEGTLTYDEMRKLYELAQNLEVDCALAMNTGHPDDIYYVCQAVHKLKEYIHEQGL